MKVFGVDKKTVNKYLLHYMTSEALYLGRPRPPPIVNDDYIKK